MATNKGKSTKKKSPETKGGFCVYVEVNKETYSATGGSLSEALANLPVITPRTKAKVAVECDGKRSKEAIFSIVDYKRLFYPGLTGEIFRARLMTLHKFS